MGWLSPTSFSDPSSTWASEASAYDGNTGTAASTSVPKGGWGGYLELNVAAISCDKVRGWFADTPNVSNFELDVYYSGAWVNIQSGEPTYGQFVEFPIGSTQVVSGMRFRFYSTKLTDPGAYCYEAEFWEVPSGTTHYGVATLVGVGALAGVGALIITGLATLAGSGALVAVGEGIYAAKATLSGLGSVVAIGRRIVYGVATLAGIGAVACIGTVGGIIHYGVAALSGVGTVIASAVATFAGKATMSGSGSVVTVGRCIFAGVAFLSGIGSITTLGQRIVIGIGALAGTGTLAVIGKRVLQGKAILTGVGTVAIIGTIFTLVPVLLTLASRSFAKTVETRSQTLTLDIRDSEYTGG